MAKLLFWIVVVFGILFALRLVSVAKLKQRAKSGAGPEGARVDAASDRMVRCARCGVYLPMAEARRVGNDYACADACTRR